ncbi:MAG: hypothetical protein IPM53_19995 [Anaerolineaceae bacterium]|nr:hypothetical protein [Anaerolineaceae bacterium]
MLTLALTWKTIFRKENQRRLAQILTNMREAAAAILLALLAVLSLLILVSLLTIHAISWLHLLSLTDEFIFLLAFLLSLYSIFGISQYVAWRIALKVLHLFTGKLRRAGWYLAAAVSGLSLRLSTTQKQTQAKIAAFWRQLQARLSHRPPGIWSAGKAPLALFQQANLLLDP